MAWTETFQDPAALRAAFRARPDARYRPIPLWWWSGETLDEERLLWQVDQIADLGAGAWCVTGLAPYGPAAGTRPDDPRGFSDEWLGLYRAACERSRDRGLGVVTWSPLLISGGHAGNHIAAQQPELRGERLRDGVPEPFGLDYGDADAVTAVVGPDTDGGRYLAAIDDLLGEVIVGMFEDEFPLMPPWASDFREQFRRMKGYELPQDVFARDHGARTPAMRWDAFDVATRRIEHAYTAWQQGFVERNDLLAGYDQMNRSGNPLDSSMYYFDPFRTMAWANAPGTDQMGDARFALSVAALTEAPRVWLEGFHSHGWGFSLADQFRMIHEWGREGASLFLPHGFYYTTQGLWWEWAPPDMGMRQPYGRHYSAFADAVGRLMSVLSAGKHVPEIVVLYPLSTVWAATISHHKAWNSEAHEAATTYLDLMGHHHAPSGTDESRFSHPSVLVEAGYDRVTVDEAHVDRFADLPIILPSCRCLTTSALRTLVEQAEAGRRVIIVGAAPAWSAERGRDDEEFLALSASLQERAVHVENAAGVLAHLPPPRVEGLRAQSRSVGDLDLVFLTGRGHARLRGMADRRPERWDVVTGDIEAVPARVDGDDLLVDLEAGFGAVLSLPFGQAAPQSPATTQQEILLPERWDASYVPWAENRWGDYRLPANPGDPPVQRRTFAHREGDNTGWEHAPVVPEDVEHEFEDLGFEDRMRGATGRPRPEDRRLPHGWREVVATFGPRARREDGALLAYSERYGVEDVVPSTHIGLRGRVEPVKADLGEGGEGTVTSFGWVPHDVATNLMVEGSGILDVWLDGRLLAEGVEGGILQIPVRLAAGWHELSIRARCRSVLPAGNVGYVAPPRTRLAWVFAAPYRHDPTSIWGGTLTHPDYKGSPGARRFRRRVRLPQDARVETQVWGPGRPHVDLPAELPAGEHVVEASIEGTAGTPGFCCELEFHMACGTLVVSSDAMWETASVDSDDWAGAFPIGKVFAPPLPQLPPPRPRRHTLTDVAWLEGEEALAGQVDGQLWSDDAPKPPPPSWFCFTAPPGARSIQLSVMGEVSAWIDGTPARVADGNLSLTEGGRVALRVQAPAGYRGAACFRDFPELELAEGTILTGVSWHRQGLDTFSGVIHHRTEVDLTGTPLAESGRAWLDLGEVVGSVAVRVNGRDAGVLFCPPWRMPVTVVAGRNVLELEVANTLGPMTSRGIPTQFSPEHQRVSGILGRPRLVVEAVETTEA